MSQNTQNPPSERVELRAIQRENLETLRKNFGLSDAELNRCLFFSRDQDEPWIPPDLTTAIARQSSKIQHIASSFGEYVRELDQLVYNAVATDTEGRSFSRPGVATRGEKPGGREIDANVLAEGRALNAVLNAAGANPFKAGTVAQIERESAAVVDRSAMDIKASDESIQRTKDLRQIHKLAEDRDLIVKLPSGGLSTSRYRSWLSERFGTQTAATLSLAERAQVINALQNFDVDFLQHIPMELREDALIA